MTADATELVTVHDSLRFLFDAFQRLLGLRVDQEEITRLFQDRDNDAVSEKSYTFAEAERVKLLGVVGEYEPETVWLSLSGGKDKVALFREIVSAYSFAYGSGASFRSAEESAAIFHRSLPGQRD